MSVINKMLRDLDQRNAANPDVAGSAAKQAGKGGVKPVGTLPNLQANPSGRERKSVLKPLLVVGSLGLVAAGAWWWKQSPKAAPQPEALAQTETVAAPANAAAYPWLNDSAAEVHAKKLMAGEAVPQSVAPVVAPAALAASAPASAAKPLQAAPVASPPAVIAKAEPVPPKPAATVPLPTPVAVAAPATTAVSSNANAAALPAQPPVPAATPAPATAPTVVDAGQRQQQAGRDALAQAQTLWSSGSKDAAIDLLQQATTTAERNLSSNPSPAGRQLLVAMVRELTRMELVDGRPAAAFEILTRLESVVAGEPDLLAVRANAAQRLGRHQDSINAYRAALQFRPAEQRWLLGSAVSMAALGQTAAAADMAEKARQVGPISKEVQAYLKQVGVVVRE